MDFMDSVKQAIEIVKLNSSAITKVASDNKATAMGVVIIIVAGVLAAIGRFSWIGIIYSPIAYLIATFIGIGIIHLLALLFGGKAKFSQFYRPIAHATILSWVSVLAFIPVLGSLLSTIAGIWELVVMVVTLKSVHKLTTGKAVIVVLIPVIVIGILMLFAAAAIMAMYGRGLGGGLLF
jgi:hypothetical protein